MIEYFIICILSALSIVGVWRILNDDSSPFLRLTYLMRILPAWTQKPLFSCLLCMSSFWGTVFFFAYSGLFHFHFGLFHWLFAIVVIAGLNTISQIIVEALDYFITSRDLIE